MSLRLAFALVLSSRRAGHPRAFAVHHHARRGRAVVALALALALQAAACYSTAKPVPAMPPLPEIVEGAQINALVYSDHGSKVARSADEWQEGEQIERMTYRDRTLTYQQVRTLADPEWNAKLARHAELARKCDRATVPRRIGYLAVVAGVGVYAYGAMVLQDRPQTIRALSLGLGGVGAVSYLAGWSLFGGWSCNSANELWDELHLDQAGERSTFDAKVTAEVRQVVLRFNREQAALAQGERSQAEDDSE